MARRRAPELPHLDPQPDWTQDLRRWKAGALRAVLSHLEHICAGPRSVPKSFGLREAVEHVVARDFDPASETGAHLLEILSSAIAQQVQARTEIPADLPDGRPVPRDFAAAYLNSRWWLDAFLQAEHVCCGDVRAAVRAALVEAEKAAADTVPV